MTTRAVSSNTLFDFKEVATGVYAAIARPQHKLNCNAAVVILEEGVLVVDTHSKPSAARAVLEQIRAITDKPVRYVFNTHYHWDHWQGNAAYRQAGSAGVVFIATEQARRGILERGLARIQAEIRDLPAEIHGLQRELRQARDRKRRACLQESLRQTEGYLAELREMEPVVPNLTFARSLVFREKDRKLSFQFLGRGHTDGDAVLYLPAERVLVSGDLVQGFLPYVGDGYPHDWVRTLDALERLEFDLIIPGHGDVLEGKKQIQLYKSYLNDLTSRVTALHSRGATLQETEAGVDLTGHYARLPQMADESEENVERAYQVVAGKARQ